jgi:CBS domain containing-hemolysin-like protein
MSDLFAPFAAMREHHRVVVDYEGNVAGVVTV